MKIYVLIHEQFLDNITCCDVEVFADKTDAKNAMRQNWESAVDKWKYNSHVHHDEDEAICGENDANIREGDEAEHWRIEEQELS